MRIQIQKTRAVDPIPIMPKKKSVIETITNSPIAVGGMALIATTHSAFAPAALLTVLVGSLGFSRYANRICEWMLDLNARMEKIKDRIDRYSDHQMSLTVGLIQTAFGTVETEKLRLLKAAILNIAQSDYLEHHQAQEFHRILRDASAADIAFLVRHRDLEGFNFYQGDQPSRDGVISIRLDNPDYAIAKNLITLGLLIRSYSEGTAGDDAAYLVGPQVPRLLQLLEDAPISGPAPRRKAAKNARRKAKRGS